MVGLACSFFNFLLNVLTLEGVKLMTKKGNSEVTLAKCPTKCHTPPMKHNGMELFQTFEAVRTSVLLFIIG